MAIKSSAPYISKGQRRSVAKQNTTKRSDRDVLAQHQFKWDAFMNGRKVFFTIDNPNPKETAKKKIRVEGKILYGDFRKYR